MKKSDIAMIILVASVSVMVAYFVVNSLPFFAVNDADTIVPHIEAINPDITPPDPLVFNQDAINPTIQAVIGSE